MAFMTAKNKRINFYTGLLCVIIFLSIWSAYIGSWIAGGSGLPMGALLRDLFTILLLIFTFLRLITIKHTVKSNFVLKITWFSVVFICILLIPFSSSVSAALNGARSYILFPALFLTVYLLSKSGVDLRISENIIVRWFLFNCLLAATLGILDVISSGEVPVYLGYNPDFAGGDFKQINVFDGILRATGGLADALNYGYLMSIGYLVSLDAIYQDKQRLLTKIYISIIAGISAFACILSFTRGAILILIVATLFYLIKYRSYFLLKIIVLLTFLILIYIGPELFEILTGRFTDSNASSAGSTQGRIDMALDSINYLYSNPMGVGLGTQGSANRFSNVDLRINTDNYFFWVALELGLLGAFIFFVYIFMQFYVAFSLRKNDSFSKLMFFLFISCGLISSAPTSAIFSINFWILLFVRRNNLSIFKK